MRLQTDLVEVITAMSEGKLDQIELAWDQRPAICVIATSKGYPGDYPTDIPITGIVDADSMPDVKVFHSGTKLAGKSLLTDGGRVLGVTALGNSVLDARRRAYSAMGKIHFEGMHYRKDIGHQALANSKEANMTARAKRFIPSILILMMFAVTAEARGTFVKAKDFDFKTLLPPPPVLGSDQAEREIDQMLKLQAERTDADVKRIKIESKMTGFIFSQSVGSWFTPDDLPVTADFLAKVLDDSKTVCKAAKDVFERKRPYLTDTRIKPCETEDSYSYPSSHSNRATVLALTIAQILPNR